MDGDWLVGGGGRESESDLFSDSLGGGERRGGRWRRTVGCSVYDVSWFDSVDADFSGRVVN